MKTAGNPFLYVIEILGALAVGVLIAPYAILRRPKRGGGP